MPWTPIGKDKPGAGEVLQPNSALQRELLRALCTPGTQPCSGTRSHFNISEHTLRAEGTTHSQQCSLQLDPTSALLKPNATKKGRLNELKWTHFQSLQLETEAFTVFHAVLFNVGGRSPFSTETFAFPFSHCLVLFFFFNKQRVLCLREALALSQETRQGRGPNI